MNLDKRIKEVKYLYKHNHMELMKTFKDLLRFVENTVIHTPDDIHHYFNFLEQMDKEFENEKDYAFWRERIKEKKVGHGRQTKI